MNGISVPFSLSEASLYIFLNWQKSMHWVLLSGILKPFVIVHWLILLMYCCSWRSAEHMYLEVIQNLSAIARFEHLGMLLIFRLKRVTDSMLPWETPSCWLWKFDWINPNWTWNLQSKQKMLMKLGTLPHSPKLCRSFIIPYFQVVLYAFSKLKKNCYEMFWHICLSYSDF